MAKGAPKGNQFWRRRQNLNGMPRAFESPEDLIEQCEDYFQWVENNPLEEEKIFHNQGEITRGTINKMRAMSIEGLCLHLGIRVSTWYLYGEREEFKETCERVTHIIKQQKFMGGMADLLNPNLVARDLGLRDSKDVKHEGGISVSEMSEGEIENRLMQLVEKMKNAT